MLITTYPGKLSHPDHNANTSSSTLYPYNANNVPFNQQGQNSNMYSQGYNYQRY